MDSNGSFFSHFSVCSTLCDRSQMARLIKPIWNGAWTSIALSGIDRASTGCWHDIAGKMIAHLGTDRYPWNIMKPSSLRRWTSATPPESTTKCIVFFQCMGKQFDDLDLSSSHSNHHSNCYTSSSHLDWLCLPRLEMANGYADEAEPWYSWRRFREAYGNIVNRWIELGYNTHRIHGAGIYANIKGVYWWDPCYHI